MNNLKVIFKRSKIIFFENDGVQEETALKVLSINIGYNPRTFLEPSIENSL